MLYRNLWWKIIVPYGLPCELQTTKLLFLLLRESCHKFRNKIEFYLFPKLAVVCKIKAIFTIKMFLKVTEEGSGGGGSYVVRASLFIAKIFVLCTIREDRWGCPKSRIRVREPIVVGPFCRRFLCIGSLSLSRLVDYWAWPIVLALKKGLLFVISLKELLRNCNIPILLSIWESEEMFIFLIFQNYRP